MIARLNNAAVSNGAEAQSQVRPDAAVSLAPGLFGRIQRFLSDGTIAPGGGYHLTCDLARAERAELNRKVASQLCAA